MQTNVRRPCSCGSGLESWWLYDAQGIELRRVCDRCEQRVRANYPPHIIRGYTQADVDEPIEPDDA